MKGAALDPAPIALRVVRRMLVEFDALTSSLQESLGDQLARLVRFLDADGLAGQANAGEDHEGSESILALFQRMLEASEWAPDQEQFRRYRALQRIGLALQTVDETTEVALEGMLRADLLREGEAPGEVGVLARLQALALRLSDPSKKTILAALAPARWDDPAVGAATLRLRVGLADGVLPPGRPLAELVKSTEIAAGLPHAGFDAAVEAITIWFTHDPSVADVKLVVRNVLPPGVALALGQWASRRSSEERLELAKWILRRDVAGPAAFGAVTDSTVDELALAREADRLIRRSAADDNARKALVAETLAGHTFASDPARGHLVTLVGWLLKKKRRKSDQAVAMTILHALARTPLDSPTALARSVAGATGLKGARRLSLGSDDVRLIDDLGVKVKKKWLAKAVATRASKFIADLR